MDATELVDALDNTTNILPDDSEPQPDAMLRVLPEAGGATRDEADYVVGACELVAEVAYSSRSIDLSAKKKAYEAAGVGEYVVFDEAAKRSIWFARVDGRFVEIKPDADGLLKSRLFPGLWLDPSAPFQRSTKPLLAALALGLATPEHAAFVAALEAEAARRASNPPPAPETPP